VSDRSFGDITAKRRVMEDGVYMLDTHLEQRDNETKMHVMENRIKRLLFEEERARREAEKARKKADSMLKARQRH